MDHARRKPFPRNLLMAIGSKDCNFALKKILSLLKLKFSMVVNVPVPSRRDGRALPFTVSRVKVMLVLD